MRDDGPRRLLAATYSLFALAAGSRAAVQLATHAGRAPLAYTLSAVAAAVYLAGAFAFRADAGPATRRFALTVCVFELTGVIVIGALSRAIPSSFPDATVWSDFGGGYGHVPVLLPLAGLWVLLLSEGAGERGDEQRDVRLGERERRADLEDVGPRAGRADQDTAGAHRVPDRSGTLFARQLDADREAGAADVQDVRMADRAQ
jgi:hypothetical protein